jgi:hypothetical protein
MDARIGLSDSREEVFKKCNLCDFCWHSRDSFLSDPGLTLVGYQPYFKDLTAGYFLFTHSCGTSLSLKAGVFSDLYSGPIFEKNMRGGDDCPGYCLNEKELKACPVECECAYVREILQIVRNWPKDSG